MGAVLVDVTTGPQPQLYGSEVVNIIASAILYYDFILTFRLEVEQFWGHRLSWASGLFFLNRYSSILFNIPLLYEYLGGPSESSCRQLHLTHHILVTVSQGFVTLLLITRIYALYNRSRKVVIFLSVIVVISGMFGGWAVLQDVHKSGVSLGPPRVPTGSCIQVLSHSGAEHYAIAWSAVLVFDTIVFILTLLRALRASRVWRGGLLELILRDGTIYFGILVAFHLANLLTFVLPKPMYRGWLATLTNVISSTLVTRMMINVREHEHCAEVPFHQLSLSRLSPMEMRRLHASSSPDGDAGSVA